MLSYIPYSSIDLSLFFFFSFMYTSWKMKEKLIKGNKIQNGNRKLCSILSGEKTKNGKGCLYIKAINRTRL